jgi:arylsulfatase A-like enzyme
MSSRREFLAGLGGAAVAFAQSERKPNIIVIVADDLGYGDTTPYGGKEIPTPAIASLARNGVRFTDGYVSCPVCSPTRAGLITGRYQQRFGHEFNPGPPAQAEENFGLPLSETTMAQRLKALGYRTGMVGKWHLGYRPEFHPMKRGFDEYYGFLGGAHSYLDLADRDNPVMRGTEPVSQIGYLTEDFTREAIAFIERRKSDPFFLYLTYNAVHNPLQATEKYLARFSHIADTRRRTFAAMLSALDDGIGQVMALVRERGIEDDTLVIFISDNGGPTPATTASNGPLRATKGQVFEGGIRVPFIMQWKRRLAAGKTYSQPVIALDILPTALAAAGAGAPAGLDGVNLLPYLAGGAGAPHEALYWRFGAQHAVRMGDWKLTASGGGQPMLFHLAKDIGETTDLAAQEPARLEQLKAAWERWNGELAPPRWGTQRAGRKQGRQRKRRR